MFNKIILIGRLGQNAEAKTAQNKRDYAILNVATQESWKNDRGEYETRTKWHRVYAWGKLSGRGSYSAVCILWTSDTFDAVHTQLTCLC